MSYVPSRGVARWLVTVSWAALWLCVSGCGGSKEDPISAKSSQYEVADGQPGPGSSASAAPGEAPQKPPALSGAALDSVAVPKGADAKGLVDFIGKIQRNLMEMQQALASGQANQDSMLPRVRDLMTAQGDAAEKLLAMKTDKETRLTAINAKMESLAVRAEISDPETAKQLMQQFIAFTQSLLQDPEPDTVRMARVILFRSKLEQLEPGQDPAAVLKEINELLADEGRDASVFDVVYQAERALQLSGHPDEAERVLRQLAESFKGHADESLSRESHEIFHHVGLNDLGYDRKVDAVLRLEPNSIGPLLEATRSALAFERPGPTVLRSVATAMIRIERDGHLTTTKEIAQLVRDAYTSSEDDQTRNAAMQLVENSERRVNLIGKPLPLAGTAIDGTAFDWAKYRGKVVLISFWVSQDRVSLQRNIEIKQTYDQFHEQGFDVVGVLLDGAQQLAQEMPWTNVRIDRSSPETSMDRELGIDANVVPFLVLVDQQGTVVGIHIKGDQLASRVEQLLTAGGSPTGQAEGVREPWEPEITYFTSLEPAGQDDQDPLPVDETSNPYAPPPGLTPAELAEFILSMETKPRSIQNRDGFCEAVVMAADRILSADGVADKYAVIAAQAKFEMLHRQASLGSEPADQSLWAFLDEMLSDSRPQIQRDVEFFGLERRILGADDLPIESIPALLAEVQEYLKGKSLATRHLRLASATVHAVNRLEDDATRERYFAEFGKVFGQSADKQLAQYGKKLAGGKSAVASELVGKPLELAGVTALGQPFDWSAYRGKVVLVDFWATWCGPCKREMPHVRELYEKLNGRGFDVVAISLDKNLDDVARYLQENQVPWVNLVGEETQALATRYGVRSIPMMMLVDRDGNVVATSHQVAQLAGRAESLTSAAE